MVATRAKTKGQPTTMTVDFEVRPPFRIMEDNRRRFIRIDIEEPISYFTIRSAEGSFWPDGDGPRGSGEILNISAGGILMFTTEPLMENAILSMSLSLEGCETIDNIIGKVKRTEIDSNGYLVGVESITREKLADAFTADEMSQLPQTLSSFTERLQELLNRYVYSRKLSHEADEE